MVNIRTVKAKECCCGCPLRTGSLILLWIILICDSIAFLYYLSDIMYGNSTRYSDLKTLKKISSLYYLFWSTAGMVTSLLGIYSIQKNIPKNLTFNLYYLIFYVAHFLLSAVLALFFSNIYKVVILGGSSFSYTSIGSGELKFIMLITYLFFIALTLYFAVIIRSTRDTMLKNLANNAGNEIPDPIAFGYNTSY